MTEVNLAVTISILFGIHLICAVITLFSISGKVRSLSKGKRNKFTLSQIDKLNGQRWLVVLLPIIGPIVGFAITCGTVLGVHDKGFRVNDPGGLDSFSDSE